jgi:hypothetical protein
MYMFTYARISLYDVLFCLIGIGSSKIAVTEGVGKWLETKMVPEGRRDFATMEIYWEARGQENG